MQVKFYPHNLLTTCFIPWKCMMRTALLKWKKPLSWTALILLRIGTGNRLLWMGQYTLEFHKMRGISWLAGNLLASPAGPSSTQMVYYKNHGVPDLHLSHHGSEFRAGHLPRTNVMHMDEEEYNTWHLLEFPCTSHVRHSHCVILLVVAWFRHQVSYCNGGLWWLTSAGEEIVAR